MKTLDTVVTIEEITQFLGTRFDKNGWKILPPRVTTESQRWIGDLYRRVFRKDIRSMNDTISLEFARGVVAESKKIKVNWAAYAVAASSKRRNLILTRKARSQQLGVPQKRVNGRVGPDFTVVSQVPSGGVPGNGLGTLPVNSEPNSAVTIDVGIGSHSGFREPPPIRVSPCPSVPLPSRVGRPLGLKGRMESASSSRRRVRVSPSGLLTASEQTAITDAVEKTITRVHHLLVDKQNYYLSRKERLKVLERERDDKELELRRAKLMRDDRQSLSDEALAEVQRVKLALEESSKYVDQWTNCLGSEGLDLSSTSGLEESEEDLQTRVADLQQQLLCEERNSRQTRLKLEATVADYERCNEGMQVFQKRYDSLLESQLCTKKFLVSVSEYLTRLKAGILDSFRPTPIERLKDHEKTNIVYVENCPACGEHFHCNDIVVASCGHCYHLFCISSLCSKSRTCIAKFCNEEFDSQWRLSFGFTEPERAPPSSTDAAVGSPNVAAMSGKTPLLQPRASSLHQKIFLKIFFFLFRCHSLLLVL